MVIIKVIQEGHKNLIINLNDAETMTIPSWKRNIALAISLYKQQGASALADEVYKATNDIKGSTAKMLKMNNAKIKEQSEKGIFDIEVMKKANQDLIDTLNESKKIVEEGKKNRQMGREEMVRLNHNLADTLKSTLEIEV